MPQSTCLRTTSFTAWASSVSNFASSNGLAGEFCLHEIKDRMRPRQAADMRGLDMVGVLLQRHRVSSQFFWLRPAAPDIAAGGAKADFYTGKQRGRLLKHKLLAAPTACEIDSAFAFNVPVHMCGETANPEPTPTLLSPPSPSAPSPSPTAW